MAYLLAENRGGHVDVIDVDENPRHNLVAVVCFFVVAKSV